MYEIDIPTVLKTFTKSHVILFMVFLDQLICVELKTYQVHYTMYQNQNLHGLKQSNLVAIKRISSNYFKKTEFNQVTFFLQKRIL